MPEQTRDALFVPGHVIAAAVRGTLGREALALADLLVRHWHQLPQATRQEVQAIVEEAIEKDNRHRRRSAARPGPLGRDADRSAWERVRRLWRGA